MGGRSTQTNVKVVVRCRPLSSGEVERGERRPRSSLAVDSAKSCVAVKTDAGGPPRCFVFDRVFAAQACQQEVYQEAARAAVMSTAQGFNATVFAYGQTGSGKTYTMQGHRDGDDRGIIPRAVADIFDAIRSSSTECGSKFLVRASFLEIYNDAISDLIRVERSGLQLREHQRSGVYVEGLSEVSRRTHHCYRAEASTQYSSLSFSSSPLCLNDTQPTHSQCAYTGGAPL